MLTPNQIRCLNDYYQGADSILYFCCERHDCDYEQMQEIVNALDPLLPGKGLDYEAILSKDPLASDTLLIHCNQTIGRLDAIYKRMMSMYDDSSRSDYTINKRTTVNVPPDWANPSFHDGKVHFQSEHNGTEKIETTSFPDKQRFKVLEAAMKCLDRSVKIQITSTQRREKLLNRKEPTRLAATQSGALPRTATKPSNQATPYTPETSLSPLRGMQGYSLSETTTPFDLNHSRESASTSDSRSQPAAANNSLSPESSASSLPLFASVPTNSTSLPSHPCPSVSIRGSNSSSQKFGPPKDFTPLPSVAEVRTDHYAWRKELKAKQQARRTSPQTTPPVSRDATRSASPPSQLEASARNAVTTNNMAQRAKENDPAILPPDRCPSVSICGSDSLPHHQRE
jgi:hypothetical protein